MKKGNKFTGMIAGNIVRQIPDTYYTGHLDNGQQAIAYYSKNNGEPDDSRCVKNGLSGGAQAVAISQSTLSEPANSSIVITHRTENTNIEYVYANVSFGAGENASLGINFSGNENYTMEFDDNGDGIVDNTTEPTNITTNHAPEISITSPIGTQSGNISIAYNLGDNESTNASILAEYSIDNSTWIEATMGAGGDGAVNITSSAEGVSHTYIWQSVTDIPVGGGNVTFRLKPIEEEIAGEFAATNSFFVLAPLRYINGTITDSVTKIPIIGVKVFYNSSVSVTTNMTGFYSLTVPEGEFDIKFKLEPEYYMYVANISTVGVSFVIRNVEIVMKPKGNISGRVTRK